MSWIGIGPRVARNGLAAQTYVIQPSGVGRQINFDVSQRLAVGQMSEGHVQEPIYAVEVVDLVIAVLQKHSSPRILNNSLSGHPQIAQSKECHQLRHVLSQPFVAHVFETELALDDAKRGSLLGAHPCLQMLSLSWQAAQRRSYVQRPTLGLTNGHMLLHAGSRMDTFHQHFHILLAFSLVDVARLA